LQPPNKVVSYIPPEKEGFKSRNAPPEFTYEFVIAATLAHMDKCVRVSIQKTLARLPEMEGDSKRSMDVFSTLLALNQLREALPSIKENLWKPPK
jgi:hypothetical protein